MRKEDNLKMNINLYNNFVLYFITSAPIIVTIFKCKYKSNNAIKHNDCHVVNYIIVTLKKHFVV